jgi:hypothetical protein
MDQYTVTKASEARAVMIDPIKDILDYFEKELKKKFSFENQVTVHLHRHVTDECVAQVMKIFKEAGYVCEHRVGAGLYIGDHELVVIIP